MATEMERQPKSAEGMGEGNMEQERTGAAPIAKGTHIDTDDAGKMRDIIDKHDDGTIRMADDAYPHAEVQHTAPLQCSPKGNKRLKTDRETSLTRERTRSKTRIKTPQRP
jgi:hypothetical protein